MAADGLVLVLQDMLLLRCVPNADLPRGIYEGQWRGEGGRGVEGSGERWNGRNGGKVEEEWREGEGGVEGGWRRSGGRGEEEWRKGGGGVKKVEGERREWRKGEEGGGRSGGRVEGEWRESGGRVEGRWRRVEGSGVNKD